MVTFLPSFTDQNRLHQVLAKTRQIIVLLFFCTYFFSGWGIDTGKGWGNNTRMADSAQMESTSEEKREILRKFKIAKKTSPGHSDCTEIKKTRVRTRVQITSNKKYSYTILKIRKSQLGKGSTYIWQINQTPGNTNVCDRYLSFAPWDVRSVLTLYQCLPSWLHVHCLTSVNSFHNVVISVWLHCQIICTLTLQSQYVSTQCCYMIFSKKRTTKLYNN